MRICKSFDSIIPSFYKKYNIPLPNFISELIKQKNSVFCLFYCCECQMNCLLKSHIDSTIEKITRYKV